MTMNVLRIDENDLNGLHRSISTYIISDDFG